MRKLFSGGLLAVYLIILTWLVLFKLAFHISPILHLHHRSLNLIPFAAPSRVHGRINYGEMIYNCIFFIPFGLLLNVNFKKPGFLRKLTLILVFSVSIELIQYIFAIGASDITDVITNLSGGLIGLVLYSVGNRYIESTILDKVIVSSGFVLLLLFIVFRSSVTIDFRDKIKPLKSDTNRNAIKSMLALTVRDESGIRRQPGQVFTD